MIRLGVPPDGLDSVYWDRVKCSRDFENGALTPWRCKTWRDVPTRYRVEYHVVCKNRDETIYNPKIPILTTDEELLALPPIKGVLCSLRYRVGYKGLWTFAAYLTPTLIGMALVIFGTLCFFYPTKEATGFSSALLLFNILVNATCHESLTHFDYVSDEAVVIMIVVRVILILTTGVGFVVYLENDRLFLGITELRYDMETAQYPSDDDDGDYTSGTDSSTSGKESHPPTRRHVGEDEDAPPATVVVEVESDPGHDPYDGDEDGEDDGGDDEGTNKED